MQDKACRKCRSFVPVNDPVTKGACRRNPPRQTGHIVYVEPDYWCEECKRPYRRKDAV